ncbi:LysR family transcriptional regulator [Pseudorhodoferax soli]|uniref:LysR family nitrogen assimilation transcriptional regulator n=1 Tax=Pseudorhodoferax soli TaxID=545864 RepID=A0A368Y0F1_9BURK|nr:LysR family transcriptional regulator [Pseudorhodoferax soli]RCW72876.1 LysR family nitrogen assimilation transcriptional regulator [Pseudorhodoferax soli]
MTRRQRDPLDLVSLRQLRYFTAAMRARSFNAASRDAAISQAALSEQIALLEATLDVQLFDRASGRAVATASGHELDRRVAACLGELQAALRDAQARANTVAGLVRVGLVQSYAGCWVLPVVRTAQALVEGVLRGDFDLAVSFDPEPHADLEILPCFVEPVVAVGAVPGKGRALRLAQLAPCRLALLPSEYAMRRQLDGAFAALGLKPQVRLESDVLEDLVRATQDGGTVALLNGAAALSLGVDGAIPILDKTLRRQACLVRSRTRHHTLAVRQVWDALVAATPRFPKPWMRSAQAA